MAEPGPPQSMRVLYFGTYDRAYPRNAQVISCLRGVDIEVLERHRPLWEQRHNWSVGLRQLARLAEAERILRKGSGGGVDALIVGFVALVDQIFGGQVCGARQRWHPIEPLFEQVSHELIRRRFRGYALGHLDRAPLRGFTVYLPFGTTPAAMPSGSATIGARI